MTVRFRLNKDSNKPLSLEEWLIMIRHYEADNNICVDMNGKKLPEEIYQHFVKEMAEGFFARQYKLLNSYKQLLDENKKIKHQLAVLQAKNGSLSRSVSMLILANKQKHKSFIRRILDFAQANSN